MIVKSLMDNEASSERFLCEHGLSLYIETGEHKILFDTGVSPAFAENAEKLGVDLAQVDTVIISHGHYDHTGGLATFLKLNDKGKIYISRHAFNHFMARREGGRLEYIGLPELPELVELGQQARTGEKLPKSSRFVLTEGETPIDQQLFLFSQPPGRCFWPEGNHQLLEESQEPGEGFIEDEFQHEQNLLIREGERSLLLVGCAHRGIVNIVEQVRTSGHPMPDWVIGGFHLHNRASGTSEEKRRILQIANYLNQTTPHYFTCHCTGKEAFGVLSTMMKDKISYLDAGSILKLPGNQAQ